MSDDLMEIDSPQNRNHLSPEKKKRKHKAKKDESPSKKRKHANDSEKIALDSPSSAKSKKDKSQKAAAAVVAISETAKAEPGSPFRLINATMYLPLSPISISPTHAAASLAAEHLAPLLLTYYPPFKGVVMAYSNASISSQPPTANQLNPSDGDNPKPLTPALTANEYGVLYLYLTATFLVFSPRKGQILEGWVNVQSEGFLGAVAYNLFSIGIERKRLPASWKWVPPGEDGDEDEDQTARTKGIASSAQTSGDEDDSTNNNKSSEFDPAKEHFTPLPKPVTNRIEMEEAAVDGQDEDDLNATGYFESVSGHPVRGTVRFRVRDIDVIPGADPDRGFISIEGTMLTPEEEAQLEDDSTRQNRAASTSMTGAVSTTDVTQNTEKETSSKKKEKKEKKDKKEKKSKKRSE